MYEKIKKILSFTIVNAAESKPQNKENKTAYAVSVLELRPSRSMLGQRAKTKTKVKLPDQGRGVLTADFV